LPCK
jgi:hypothetical protein